jgi:hypothetical protein
VGGKGEGGGWGGEMTQALYAYMNNKIKKKRNLFFALVFLPYPWLLLPLIFSQPSLLFCTWLLGDWLHYPNVSSSKEQ